MLKHISPHKLRHTGATLAKQAGTPMEAIFNPYLLHLHKMIMTYK